MLLKSGNFEFSRDLLADCAFVIAIRARLEVARSVDVSE